MGKDIVIIGGGIVGLATAYQLKQAKPDLNITLVEKENTLAKHQTGNNSGVIHSGIYYKPGSLKAINCINGYHLLLDFVQKNNIAYNLCGKVIVATSKAEIPALETIYQRGLQNGLNKIRKIGLEELKSIEPHVNGLEGIQVPETGIIDYTEVCQKLGELFKAAGGEIISGSKVTTIKKTATGATIVSEKKEIETKLVVNCAGLYSDKIARMTGTDINVKIIPFRGEYYELRPEKHYLVKTLIYPVPDPNFPFLGVHFTNMVHGGVEAGPNAVFAFKREGYKMTDISVSETAEALAWPGFQKVMLKYWKTGIGEYYRSFSKAAFTKALQKLVPEIREEDLVSGGAGVRAQACDRTGGLLDDFSIFENDIAINVLNAPSPAATSSLSIGKTVAELALKRF